MCRTKLREEVTQHEQALSLSLLESSVLFQPPVAEIHNVFIVANVQKERCLCRLLCADLDVNFSFLFLLLLPSGWLQFTTHSLCDCPLFMWQTLFARTVASATKDVVECSFTSGIPH